jgi:hypothetical protein
LLTVAAASNRQIRGPQAVDDRRDDMWAKHLALLRHRGEFIAKYRMSEESFYKLEHLLSPYLEVDEVKSRNSTSGIQPIDKRFIIAVGLRWLGGWNHNGLDEIYNISSSSSRRIVSRFIDAVNATINNIYLPTEETELEALVRVRYGG